MGDAGQAAFRISTGRDVLRVELGGTIVKRRHAMHSRTAAREAYRRGVNHRTFCD
jgi:hypothetical protein